MPREDFNALLAPKLQTPISQNMSDPKTITLNGEARSTHAATIAALVRELELSPQKVAVECNAVIVPRSTLEAVLLNDGDVLEIVHFVGGG